MCSCPDKAVNCSQAEPNMVKSTVVDNETGKSIDSTVRTSTGTFFGREVRIFLLRDHIPTSYSCRDMACLRPLRSL